MSACISISPLGDRCFFKYKFYVMCYSLQLVLDKKKQNEDICFNYLGKKGIETHHAVWLDCAKFFKENIGDLERVNICRTMKAKQKNQTEGVPLVWAENTCRKKKQLCGV